MAAQLAPAIIDAQLEWLGIAAAERPELARKLGTPQCQQIAALRDRLGVDSDSETATAEKAALLAALREAVRTEAERRRRVAGRPADELFCMRCAQVYSLRAVPEP